VFDVAYRFPLSSCSCSWWTSPIRWFRLPAVQLCTVVSWRLSCISLLINCLTIVAGFFSIVGLKAGCPCNLFIGLLAMQPAFIVMIPLLWTCVFLVRPQKPRLALFLAFSKNPRICSIEGIQYVLIFSGLQMVFGSAWMDARAHWNFSWAGPNVAWFTLRSIGSFDIFKHCFSSSTVSAKCRSRVRSWITPNKSQQQKQQMACHLPDRRRICVVTALREERVWRIQFKRVLESLVRESLENSAEGERSNGKTADFGPWGAAVRRCQDLTVPGAVGISKSRSRGVKPSRSVKIPK